MQQTKRTEAFYRPELDLLRLLAFLMVYVHHSITALHTPAMLVVVKACASGMQIFFVLSSYLITELLLRESEKAGTIDIPAFFRRRILRIWPLYFAFVLGYILISQIFHSHTLSLVGVLSLLLLSGNWYTVAFDFLPPLISPLWSISLEEQYYLIWPFLGKFGGRRGLWIASLISIFGAYLALFVLGPRRFPLPSIWANSFVEFQFFAVGAILALILHGKHFAPSSSTRALLLLVSLISIAVARTSFHFMDDFQTFRSLGPAYLLVAIGVTTLFLSIQRLPVPESWRPLLYLGKISYGLYVLHMSAFSLATRMLLHLKIGSVPLCILRSSLGLGLAIAFASLSYRFLELPFLRWKRRFETIPTREPEHAQAA